MTKKADNAVFELLDKQVYKCTLYENGVVVDTIPHIQGSKVPEQKDELEAKYPGIVVEMA